MSAQVRLLLAAACLLLPMSAPTSAHAGLLFLPEGPGTPGAGKDPGYRVLYSTTRATVTDEAVESHTEDVVAGPVTGAGRFTGLIPLPEGAPASRAEVLVDGHAVEVRILDAAAAQKVLFDLGRRTGNARLAAFAGRPMLLLPSVALGRRSRVETSLWLPVIDTNGLRDLRLPLPAPTFSAGPLSRVTVVANIASKRPLRVVTSPSHDITVERKSAREAVVRFSHDQVAETEDLRVLFAADDDELGLRVLTHRSEGAEHGYFLLVGNPTGGQASHTGSSDNRPTSPGPTPKDLVLVLDTSGSMRGEKHEQSQLAAEYVIDHLGPDDRFNVIAFGTEVRPFRPQVVAASAEERAVARAFVQALLAVGQTNISGALSQALGGGASSGDRPRLVLFLTDGTPTVGELDPEKIAAVAQRQNRGLQRIFALGVGHDVNAHLLDRLSRDSGGLSFYVEPDEDLDVRVAALYDGLSHPVLTGVQLDTGGLKVTNLLPTAPSSLFQGQEIMLAGRYSGGGRHTLTLKGVSGGAARAFTVTAEFPKDARPENGFVSWLWASRRIGELLAEIRLGGQSKTAVAEVVALSQAFGIVTEYTAFIGTSDRVYSDAEAQEEAGRLMGTANAQTSGRWAVKQSFNEGKLRARKVSSVEENTWEDQQGEVQKADNIRTLDGKAYYKRAGRWTESGPKPAKSRRVKKFSPEYFDLVEKNKDFARAQSLDADTSVDVGDTRVEVY